MNWSRLSKIFAVYQTKKNNMVQIMSKLSVILKTKILIPIFYTSCKISITSLTSTVFEYYYFGRHNIKMEPFLKQQVDLSTNKISILKMESSETAEKALRLSFLIGTFKNVYKR